MIYYESYTRLDGQFAQHRMELFDTGLCDSASEYNHNPDAWHLDRLTTIRNATTSTKYISTYSATISLCWQMDHESWNDRKQVWYACKIDDTELSVPAAKLISRLTRSLAKLEQDYDPTPANVVMALKAKRVARVDGCSSTGGFFDWNDVDGGRNPCEPCWAFPAYHDHDGNRFELVDDAGKTAQYRDVQTSEHVVFEMQRNGQLRYSGCHSVGIK